MGPPSCPPQCQGPAQGPVGAPGREAQKRGRRQRPDGARASLRVGRKGAVLGNREIYSPKGTRLPLGDPISFLSTSLWICVGDIEAPITSLPFPPPAVPRDLESGGDLPSGSVTLAPELRSRYFRKSSSFDLRQRHPRSRRASLLLPRAPSRPGPAGASGPAIHLAP